MSEWIEWKGGHYPGDEDDYVDIRIARIGLSFDNIPQDRIDWWEDAPLLYRPSKAPYTHKVNG